MANYDLGTIGYTIQNTGGPQATAEITQLANAADTKLSPAAQRVIDRMRETRAIMQRVEQQTQTVNRAFSSMEISQAAQRMQGFENALANSRGGMNSFGVVTQQAGYQIGDFLVQVQSGTNWMVAFGQQATQLVGILPMMTGFMGLSTTALVGLSAGLGIAIPLVTALGAIFMRTSQDSNALTQSLERQKNILEGLKEAISSVRLERQMLQSGAGSEVEQQALNEIVRLDLQRSGILYEMQQINNQINQGLDTGLEIKLEQKQAELDTNAAARASLETYLQTLKAEEQRLAKIEALKNAHAQQVQFVAAAANQQRLMTISAQAALGKYSMMRTVAAGVANELARAADETERMARKQASLNYGKILNTGESGPDAARREVMANRPNPFGVLAGGAAGVARVERESGGSGRRQAQLRREIQLVKELTQAEKDRQTIVSSVRSTLEDSFMSMVDGTKSVKDAFKSMAYEIIRELYRVLVVQRAVNTLMSAFGLVATPTATTTSFGTPNTFGGGRAVGGSIMPRQAYLVGENGPELIVPRHSGTVVNANQTSAMGSGGGITVQNNISVTGSDAAMVRAEVAKMIPQITNATKAAVIDARLRGGQMKAAFS
jgi:hypothetical protein